MKYEHVSVMFLTGTFQLIKDNWNLVFVQNKAFLYQKKTVASWKNFKQQTLNGMEASQ